MTGHRTRAALALLAALLALAGCGQKGPLYLPGSPEDPDAAQAPAGDAGERDAGERDAGERDAEDGDDE